MAKEHGPMSGFRDMFADQMIPRQEALDTIRGVYENYGFSPLKTPALERLDTLTGRYGDEGEKLIYSFKDNGGRDVAMRYDQTVPLARVVAQYGGQLPNPYKRYAIGEVWRGEKPGAGRFREFTQFDADTVGSDSILSDAEIIAMMVDSMGALGVEAKVRVNDRRILDGLGAKIGVESDDQFRLLVGVVDKVDKIGRDAVVEEVGRLFGADASLVAEEYLGSIQSDSIIDDLHNLLNNETAEAGIRSVDKIFELLSRAGYDGRAVIDPSIARGLDYYTGTIYETTMIPVPEIGSVCSGGRFDHLIEELGGPDTPAVGTSIGVDRLLEGLRIAHGQEAIKTPTEVYVANMGPELDIEQFALVQDLRKDGIAADFFVENQRLAKQLKKIAGLGIKHVLIQGEDEVRGGTVQLKNLDSGSQTEIRYQDVSMILRGEDE